MSNSFPRFGNFSSLNKHSGSFSLSCSSTPSILLSIFPIKFDKSCRVSSLFRNLILSQLNPHSFFHLICPVTCVLQYVLYFIHWIPQFQDLCLVLFYNFNFFGKEFLFDNFILQFIKLPEFSCSWLNFFITDILNPLSIRYQYSMSLSLVAGELSFSFCEVIFPLFFIVFDSMSFCFHTVFIGSYISTGWQLENFPGGSDCKETARSVGDLGLIPGLGRSPGEGKSYFFQLSCLENPMDRGAWRVHGIIVRQD